MVPSTTPDRWQSKTFLTNDERGSKFARNSVSGDKWQSKTLFLTIFYPRSSILLTFSIVAYLVFTLLKLQQRWWTLNCHCFGCNLLTGLKAMLRSTVLIRGITTIITGRNVLTFVA